MDKLHVDIADGDAEYLARLLRYVRNDQTWRERVELRAASSLPGLQAMLQEREPDLLVAGTSWLEEIGKLKIRCPVAALADRRTKDGGNGKTILKYQAVPDLLEQIMAVSAMAKDGQHAPPGSPGSSRIVAVYSAVGGVGKSTLCLHLLRVWKRERLRALYVNLETLLSSGWYGDGDWAERSSRFLYMLQHQPRQFGDSWPAFASRHHDFDFEMLPPLVHILDGLQMREEHVLRGLETIRHSGRYDMIAVDLDSGCNERITGAFKAADDIVWLETQDAVGRGKSERMLDSLPHVTGADSERVLRKIRRVRHRMPSPVSAEEPSLPYIPEWKHAPGWLSIWKHEGYTQAVTRLHRKWWANPA